MARQAKRPLDGKVAIVTGAARNIGRAIAIALAEDGCAGVVINGRSARSEAEKVAAEVEAVGARALVYIGDVSKEDVVKRMIAAAVRKFRRIDIVVNNASVRPSCAVADMSFADWRKVMSINLDGPFLCAKYSLPHIAKNQDGRIINIGGASGHLGAKNRAHVVTSKAALVGLSKALAHEYGDKGVTVNVVSPGRIETVRPTSAGVQPTLEHGPLVGRRGVPNDIAGMVRFLCRPDSGFITGQTLHVNGGIYLP